MKITKNMSLNEILSILGITKGPAKQEYKYRLFKNGKPLGDFSANDTWKFLRLNNLINF